MKTLDPSIAPSLAHLFLGVIGLGRHIAERTMSAGDLASDLGFSVAFVDRLRGLEGSLAWHDVAAALGGVQPAQPELPASAQPGKNVPTHKASDPVPPRAEWDEVTSYFQTLGHRVLLLLFSGERSPADRTLLEAVRARVAAADLPTRARRWMTEVVGPNPCPTLR